MSHLNLISLFGIFVMLFLAWLVSSHRTKVNWRLVGSGILLQLALAALFFQSQNWTMDGAYPNGVLFAMLDSVFKSIQEFVDAGSGFVFNANGIAEGNPTDPKVVLKTFAFGVLPTVIFFASLMAILYHIGIMQWLIRGMAWVLSLIHI